MSDLDKAIRDKLNLTSPDHPRSWNELAYAKALTAVLDLHAHRVPDGWHRTDGSPLWWCDGCKSIVLHRSNACDTKRAIAAALGVSGEDRSEPTPARRPGCWCARCHPATGFRVMNLCPDCGNKRCPRATHHIHECTGSNEPGQPGSDYANIRRVEVVTPEGPA